MINLHMRSVYIKIYKSIIDLDEIVIKYKLLRNKISVINIKPTFILFVKLAVRLGSLARFEFMRL